MLTGQLVGCLLIAWLFLFYNVPAIIWLASGLLYLAISYTLGAYSLFFTSLLALVFFTGYSLLAIKPVRRHLITKNVISFFRKKLPKISATESQAIDAGDVWWEGDIFSADLNWNKFNKHKLTELTSEEKSFLSNQTNELCALLDDWDIVHHSKDLSTKAWEYLKANQFFAIAIPKEYGGLGFSATAQSCIVTKIATRSITTAVNIMVPNALGPAELLLHYGTDEQKKYYMPRLASCEEIPCFALTSLYAGSDAGGMLDSGVICRENYQGKETLGIKLNFSKRYITLAPIATVMGLAIKLYDPDCLYSNKEDLGVTLALIPTDHPGISVGRRHMAMFTPFQNGPISGEDVFIPMNFIIGEEDYIGKGWFMLMECLSGGRGISLPALSAATTQTSYLSSVAYSNLRKQFKTPISSLEGIQEYLVKVSGLNYIVNAVNQVTCSAIDHGLKPAVISGISKYHTTEFSRDCINAAMDIHAGKAVMNGPNNYLASLYTACPVAITVEGANILTRNLIIFGQGAFRAHPYVLKELEALNEKNDNYALSKFDKVLFKHIKFVCSNLVKILTYNVQLIYRPLFKRKDPIACAKKDLTKLSTSLALATDMALLFVGGKLKVKERMSARLGDIVSNIYLGLCIIKLHHELSKLNKDNTEYLKSLNLQVQWCLDYVTNRADIALAEFTENFPIRSVSIFLKILLQPFGRRYKKPSDKLESKIAGLLTHPSGFFNNMTELCYKENSPLGKIASVFNNGYQNRELLDKIDDLILERKITGSNCLQVTFNEAFTKNLITESEYAILNEYAKQVDEIISVDDFDSLIENMESSLEHNKNDVYQQVV